MQKFTLLLIIISLLAISCEKEIVKFSKLSENQKLDPGEWLDSSDTLNGISIRENYIAFFEKMMFNSEQISNYHLKDSIYKKNESEIKVGEYLFVEKNSDTLIYKIIKKDKNTILLEDSNKNQKTYNFWR